MAEPIVNTLGIVGIKNCGEYDNTVNYEKLNVVSYQGSSYCAKGNTVGNVPTNTSYWELLAQKGETGNTGPEGPEGPKPVKGVDYYTAEDIAELEANLNIDVTTEVSNQLSLLSSATPLAASSVAGMVDTTRIYVNTSDGHWYWYNGSTWNDGGVYQGEVLSTEDNERINVLESEIFDFNGTTTNNGYVKSDGTFNTTSTTNTRSDYIDLKDYTDIEYLAYEGSSACEIAFFDSNKSFLATPSVIGDSTKVVKKLSRPLTAKYCILSNYTPQVSLPYIKLSKDNNMHEKVETLVPLKQQMLDVYPQIFDSEFEADITNKSVNTSGEIVVTSNTNITNFIEIGSYKKIDYAGWINSTYNLLSFYDEDKEYISDSGIVGTNAQTSGSILKENFPTGAKYVVLATWNGAQVVQYVKLSTPDSLAKKINFSTSILNGKKVGFLGDSITNGYKSDKSFGQMIAEATGCIRYNYGINRSRISNTGDPAETNPMCLRYSSMDATLDYICVMGGTNDFGGHIDLGLPTSTDNTTFNGALNELILGLITRYTKKKIMFVTPIPRRTSGNLVDYVNAVKERCAYYSIPCLDLYTASGLDCNIDIINNELFGEQDGLHPNTDGTKLIANKIQSALERL